MHNKITNKNQRIFSQNRCNHVAINMCLHHLMNFYRLMQIQQLFMKYLFVSLRFATFEFDVTVDGFPKNDLKTQTMKVLFRWTMNQHLQYLFNSNMKKKIPTKLNAVPFFMMVTSIFS